MHRIIPLLIALATLAVSGTAAAAEHRGQVAFNGLPVPGATVTATQGKRHLVTSTDAQGVYVFPDLPDGAWTVEVTMTGFAPGKQEVVAGPSAPPAKWELKLLPLDQIKAAPAPAASHAIAATPAPAPHRKEAAAKPTPASAAPKPAASNEAPESELSQKASDGFLINGSVMNGASSPFAQSFAFGNNRSGMRGLYTGGLGVIFDNSALDARPFSLSGQNTPKPAYNRITGIATFGGPLKIPHLGRHRPNIFAAYEWSRYVDASTQSALVPTAAERAGDFSPAAQIFDPSTGLPFSGNAIPPAQISPQASALLRLYPLPSFSGDPRYNYQAAISDSTHQDALQSRFNENINAKNQLYGGFAFQSTRTASPNLFGFLDSTDVLGTNSNLSWSHHTGQRVFMTFGYRFSRTATRSTPYWEGRENVSGNAGVAGNDQDAADWGPPSLTFSSGLAALTDGQSSHDRNQTGAGSYSLLWYHERHSVTLGGDFRRQEFNYLSQQNARGTLTFTGAATRGSVNGTATGGADFADFLLGVPDTSAIAFGNADKYFRQSVYDVYMQDDWRVRPEFTLNVGLRWEYGAPIEELYGRLVNLDVAPGFAAVAQVVGSKAVGPLTGRTYPNSLIWPDRRGIQPRVGIAWRPISGSSLLVRAGYGIYDDTSVYQTIAQQMAQQAPLSKSLSVENSQACPLTLANPFNACSATTPNTYAVDPHFRIGYAQTWQASVQRDLPGSLQLTASYLGTKGTRGLQEFLPNTYPLGGENPCADCPSGFVYLTSNGNSTHQEGQVQLRRRLHNGLTATLRYTYAKSLDDDSALGGAGPVMPTQTFGIGAGTSGSSGAVVVSTASTSSASSSIAQNWRDLRAERGPSTFDQRHLLSLQVQYSTGMGLGGKTLMRGWKGTLYKEWTVITQITVGSGLPETPIYLAATPGTGFTGSIRPDYTGAPIYTAAAGYFLNSAAYSAPTSGEWGNAGRDSITGPSQFALSASMGRTFRVNSRYNLDFRIDSTNFLNHATFTAWDTTVNSTQFGLPTAANAMRSLRATLRLRF